MKGIKFHHPSTDIRPNSNNSNSARMRRVLVTSRGRSLPIKMTTGKITSCPTCWTNGPGRGGCLMDTLFFIFLAILTFLTSVSCQQQYFRTRPQPHVEVIQGSTFTLECAVGNQAGSVQWSKNGFLLGKWYNLNLLLHLLTHLQLILSLFLSLSRLTGRNNWPG